MKCKKCGDIIKATGFIPFTQCKCGKTFVDGLKVKDMFRIGGCFEDIKPKKRHLKKQ